MGLFARFRNPLLLLTLVLAQTLWLAVQVQRTVRPGFAVGSPEEGHKVTLLRSWAMAVFSPVERTVQGTSAGVRHLWANYVDLRHAREQNLALHGQIARLREEQASFAEDAAQGRRLQGLLGFKQQYIAKTVAAEVIGASGSDQSQVLWINKGADDGLRPEQAVITPDGAVGKLRDVLPHTAQLLLLDDANSGAGVVLSSTRMRGVLRGTATGDLVINNLTSDDRIKPGEHVITSGGDQVFPRGLPVGVIASIAPDVQHPPYTVITIKPAANLRQLEEVLVITGTETSLPASAQADAGQAEVTAESNKRAADLVAERLPSIHDGTAQPPPGAAAAAADTAVSNGSNLAVPKVQPPLHEDRYSQGATPPAADLTPGAPHRP